jgi:hypothetical protein
MLFIYSNLLVLCFALTLLGTNDESLDVSSHLGWKNAAASYHETKAFMDR